MGFLLIILGIILGLIGFGWIWVLFEYLYYKAKGFVLITVAGLFIRWDRDYYDKENPGKMKFSRTRLNQIYPTVLMYKKGADEEVRKSTFHTVLAVVLAVTFAVLTLMNGYGAFDSMKQEVRGFLGGLCAGAFGFFFSISYYNIKRHKKPEGLEARIWELSMSMQQAKTEEDLVAQPFDHAMFGSAALGSKIRYLCSFYRVAEMRNDLAAMSECIDEMTRLKTVGLTDMGHFYLDTVLFSYYSFRHKVPILATQFYQHSKRNIDADTDANGRRKLAYYAFYVLNDKEAAKKHVEEGLSALSVDDPRQLEIFLKFEEKMLLYLKSQLQQ